MDLTTLTESVTYPWDDGDAGTLLVVGGVLTLLAPLVLPAVVVLGIGLRVVEAVIDGYLSPPAVEDWTGTAVDGLKAAVVVAVYAVVPLAVGVALFTALLGTLGFRPGGLPTPGGSVGTGGLAAVFGLLVGALALGVAYLTPAALVHLARTRRLGAAFAFADVRALAAADGYASAWLLALVVFAGNGLVLAVLSVTPGGVLLNGFVTFYAVLAMAFLYGRGARGAGFEVEPAERSGGPPAASDTS